MNRPSILITGCSSGIGLNAARTLHQRGYHVMATVRKKEHLAVLRQAGMTTTLLDLDDSDSIRHAFDETLTCFQGRLDYLFNNAAYGQPGALEDLSRQALRQQFETNVFGTQELTNLAISHMRQQGHGRIIFNSSVLGLVAMAYRGAYNASKYALEALADTLRLELADTPIHISLIEPGPIESQFRSHAYAKFKQHVDATTSPHRAIYATMERRFVQSGPVAPFTLPPDAVTQALIHALESRHPKIRYAVTVPTTLLAIFKRILPARMLDWLLHKLAQHENQ